jgi:DNA-binding transcriptional MerR regulator
LYDDADVARLHRVLLFRELGLALDDIATALDDDDPEAVLQQHRAVLVTRRTRLDSMIAALDRMIANREKGTNMTAHDIEKLFEGFDPQTHEDEARTRWGGTPAWEESQRRTARYTKADWDRYKQEAAAIGARLVAAMQADTPVTDAGVQSAVEDHRRLIDRWFYPCSRAMHAQLAEMYVTDPRFRANLDKLAPGHAQYLHDAIVAAPAAGDKT